MKILIFSDLHLHTWKTFGSYTKYIPKRLNDQIKILNQIREIGINTKIDICVFGGDWFNKRGEIPTECLNITSQWLNDLPFKMLFTRGNHDLVRDTGYDDICDAISVFSKLSNNIEKEENYQNIKLVHYFDSIDEDKIKGYDLVVVHKTPIGASLGNWKFKDGVNWRKISSNNKFVLFGHIHQRQQLANNCYVVGSPMSLDFSDTNDRGVHIVDLDKNTVEFIKLDYPEFIVIDDPNKLDNINDNNYYKVLNSNTTISGDNVISVVVPERFDERIKSSEFNSIIDEWLEINKKGKEYKEQISDLLLDKVNYFSKIFKGRLISIDIENFGSYEKETIDIKNGFIDVIGINKDSDSNGSGKTTIFESIYYCFFGENTKGLTKDSVIRDTPILQNEAIVTATLIDDDIIYIISRSTKTGLSIVKKSSSEESNLTDGLTKPKRQDFLESQILGFNKNIFLSSCYFSQESLSMLTNIGDTDKTNMICSLLGFEVYDDLNKKCGDLINEISDNINSFNQIIKDEENSIANEKNIILVHTDNIEQYTNDIQKILSEKEVKEEERKKIKDAISNRSFSENTVNYDTDISFFSDSIEAINKSLNTLRRTVEELNNNKLTLISSKSSISTKIKLKKAESDNITNEINRLQNLSFGEKCKICGSIIDKGNVDDYILFKKEGQSNIDTEIEISLEENEKFDILISKIDESINHTNITINSKTKKIEEFRESMYKLKEEKEGKLREKIRYDEETKRLNDQLVNIGMLIKNMYVSIEDNNNKITLTKEKIEKSNSKIKNSIQTIDMTKEKMLKEEEKIEIYTFWKNSFSSKGIRTLLLDHFCNEFNILANQYLSQISNGLMRLVIKPISTTASGELRNKLSINVYIDSYIRDYKQLSGGEKRRADISICLALNKWIENKYNVKDGILKLIILDEIFSYIDRIGEEAIAEVLKSEGSRKSVYVITHTSDIGSYTDDTICVIKENNISRIEK